MEGLLTFLEVGYLNKKFVFGPGELAEQLRTLVAPAPSTHMVVHI